MKLFQRSRELYLNKIIFPDENYDKPRQYTKK